MAEEAIAKFSLNFEVRTAELLNLEENTIGLPEMDENTLSFVVQPKKINTLYIET